MPKAAFQPAILWPALFLALIGSLLGCGANSEVKPQVEKSRETTEATAKVKETKEAPDSGEKTTSVPVNRELTPGGVKPAKDDTLVLLYADDPDTLNIITSSDTVSTAFQRQVYEPLAAQSFSNPDEWDPALAESWSFDEEKLTYTIKLRKGVYWHPMKLPSGKELPKTEFTAADVKFTFDCILNENVEAASLRSYYTKSDLQAAEKYKIKVTVIDDYTIKVKWSEPYFMAFEFTLGIQPMPRHVYGVDDKGEPITLDYIGSKDFASALNNHWANTRMCGTGPLIFQEWKKKEEVTLKRNPDYWGAPFYFSRVSYRHISNPNTALQQTLNGDLDFAGIAQKDLYIQSQTAPNVEAGKVKLFDFEYPGYRYLGYNLRRDFFKDKRVRQAIGHAIPIDEIIDKIYFNLASRLTGPFLPGSSANDASLPPLEFNLDKAKALLDEAGWKDSNGDGVRDNTVAGKKVDAKFQLMIPADSPQYLQMGEIVKENCRKLGVEVTISPAQWALMLQRLKKKEFDATILGWALEWKQDPFQIFHGSQAELPDSSNHGGYSNPEVDKLIEELRITMDTEKQTAIYHKIHRLIYDDQPYTFLFVDRQTGGRNARLENIDFYRIRPCFDVREWTTSTPRLAP